MKIHGFALSTLVIVLVWANPSLAHHVMDGDIPRTFLHGFLSGLGHPVIGLDHLAFVVAVGLISFLYQNPYLPPFAFLTGMLGGVVLRLTSFELYLVELAISGSVILLGVLAIRAKYVPMHIVVCGFLIVGIFHGYAYGSSIIGAELTPLAAYLIGLLAVQYAIAAVVIKLLRLQADTNNSEVPKRVVGGIVLGIGLTFMLESLSTYSAL